MPNPNLFCIIDFETYSEVDLKKVGAYEYSVHPSTDIICVSWRIGTGDTKTFAPALHHHATRKKILAHLEGAVLSDSVLFFAHNAFFDAMIFKNVFIRRYMPGIKNIPWRRWHCTAAMASAMAFPRSLEGVSGALGLPVQKDKEGRKLVLKWCKPSGKTKTKRHDNLDELKRLMQYCESDIEVTAKVRERLPLLEGDERKLWLLDQKINSTGIRIDTGLVHNVQKLIYKEKQLLEASVHALTCGEVESAREVKAVLKWLREKENLWLKDLTKSTIEETLASTKLTDAARNLLKLRQVSSKSSTAKFKNFLYRSASDGRVRDILVYHAARTGRWASHGIQIQNMARGKASHQHAVSVINSDQTDDDKLEQLRLLYRDPMLVFPSLLRPTLIADEGHIFDIADYAQIEVRILFWLSNHSDGLSAFLGTRDIYKEQAMALYGIRSAEEVTDEQRYMGKQLILGCGFALGGPGFQANLARQGVKVSDQFSKLAVETYRQTHPPVRELWGQLEKAAIDAVSSGDPRQVNSKITYYIDGDFLLCRLPSGRELKYFKPEIRIEPTPWGAMKKALYTWSVNPKNKKWELRKIHGGLLTENCCQAIARDLIADAALRISKHGPWRLSFHVHDELIGQRRKDDSETTNQDFKRLMERAPNWAKGIPLKVSCFESERYRKD